MDTSKFWRGLGKVIGGTVSCVPAVANGLLSVAQGKTFDEGADKIFDAAVKAGGEFGEKHGDTIERTLVTSATLAITALGVKSVAQGRNPVEIAKESLGAKKNLPPGAGRPS